MGAEKPKGNVPDFASSATLGTAKSGDGGGTAVTSADAVQDVMADNLELMLEVVMQIREDEDFARSIYENCPRLQHLLDRHPDLRPVFEDPNLVRINFEEVYRQAGGVLPEDRPARIKRILKCVVNHPLFKLFRFLLLIKKCYTCFVGGGMSLLRSCLCAACAEEAADHAADNLDSADGADLDGLANKEALNRAADHMEGE
jgi:hypothetical protein